MNLTIKNNDFYEFSDAIKFIKSSFFPFFRAKKRYFKGEFVLGIGGNIGNVKKRFENFFMNLKNDKRFFVTQNSVILKNRAFGYTKQDDFLNAVMFVQTSLSPNTTLKIMQRYELKFGRKRSFKNAPRTLDLDILYFDKKVRKSPRLILPHYGVNERISVILPLGLMR